MYTPKFLITLLIMAILPNASFASNGLNNLNRVYEATYVNFSGEYLYFLRESFENIVDVERIEDAGVYTSLCSTKTVFCVGRITLPAGDIKENMKWQANGTTFFSGKWKKFFILNNEMSLIEISSGRLNLDGSSVTPYISL